MGRYLEVATMREYVDPSGTRWRRRGTRMEWRALERRSRHKDVILLHHYLGTVTEVPYELREQFWAVAKHRMAESVHSGFWGAEFKDDAGRHLVIVDESC